MVAVIKMVRDNGWRLPVQIQVDLQIRLYRMFKGMADQMSASNLHQAIPVRGRSQATRICALCSPAIAA
ncbi:MAG: hypothetical protein WBP64_05330 [Nitrososphaeraceae archaeon]